MHSTARRCGYPSVSIRAAREPARGAAGELSLANAVFRRRRSTTSPPPPGPAASVAGFGATRPDRGPGGLGTSHPPPLPAAAAGRARRHPPGPRWVAWRVGLTADRFRITGPAGRAPPSLTLGVSWAARWCAGSPELCTSLARNPLASWLGRADGVQLPGQCYRVWTASGADSDEAHSLRSVTRIVTRAGARVRSVRVSPPQRPAARHARQPAARLQRRPVSRLGPGKPSQGCAVSSWTGRRAGQRSAGIAPGQQARAWAMHYLCPAGVVSNGAGSSLRQPGRRGPGPGAGPGANSVPGI
jgi:hypothetical protein